MTNRSPFLVNREELERDWENEVGRFFEELGPEVSAATAHLRTMMKLKYINKQAFECIDNVRHLMDIGFIGILQTQKASSKPNAMYKPSEQKKVKSSERSQLGQNSHNSDLSLSKWEFELNETVYIHIGEYLNLARTIMRTDLDNTKYYLLKVIDIGHRQLPWNSGYYKLVTESNIFKYPRH